MIEIVNEDGYFWATSVMGECERLFEALDGAFAHVQRGERALRAWGAILRSVLAIQLRARDQLLEAIGAHLDADPVSTPHSSRQPENAQFCPLSEPPEPPGRERGVVLSLIDRPIKTIKDLERVVGAKITWDPGTWTEDDIVWFFEERRKWYGWKYVRSNARYMIHERAFVDSL